MSIVATEQYYDYITPEARVAKVQQLAEKCVGTGLMARVLRPLRSAQLNAMVGVKDVLYREGLTDEDYIDEDQYTYVPGPVRGYDLAEMIIEQSQERTA